MHQPFKLSPRGYFGVYLANKKSQKNQSKKSDTQKPNVNKKILSDSKQPIKNKPIVVSEELRRVWIRIRKSWSINRIAFTNSLSSLTDAQANELYSIIAVILYKNSYVEIIRENKEFGKIIKNDGDRICMYDIYEVLSWRLNKKVSLPKKVELKMRVGASIGREAQDPLF